MKLLLVVPPSPHHHRIIRNIDCSHESKADYLWHPNDLLLLSAKARPEDDVAFVDGTADRLSDEQFFADLKAHRDAEVLVFCLSATAWESDLKYYRRAKELLGETLHYVLGDIFLEEPYQESILKEARGVLMDPIAASPEQMANPQGAVDGVLTEVGQSIFTSKTKPEYRSIAVPRHELFLKPGYCFPFSLRKRFATVTLMWGCPFTCSYCTDASFPPMVRDPASLSEEFELLKSLGIREIFFADKTFGFPAKVSKPVLREMAQNYEFGFCCYFHPQHYEAELLDLMHQAGCHTIIIGIDSVDLESLRKYNRRVNQEKLMQLLEHANRLKVNVCADFIFGLRHENAEDVQKTVDFALSLPLDFASFNIAAPLPGSEIRKEAIEQGLLEHNQEGFDTLGRAGIVGHDKADSQSIKRIRDKAIKQFYLRPSYVLRRLSRTRSLEHFIIQIRQAKGLFFNS